MKRWSSSDFYMVAYLLALPDNGLELVGLDRSDPKRVEFVLDGEPDPEDLAAYATDGLVPVKAFVRELRALKFALYRGEGSR